MACRGILEFVVTCTTFSFKLKSSLAVQQHHQLYRWTFSREGIQMWVRTSRGGEILHSYRCPVGVLSVQKGLKERQRQTEWRSLLADHKNPFSQSAAATPRTSNKRTEKTTTLLFFINTQGYLFLLSLWDTSIENQFISHRTQTLSQRTILSKWGSVSLGQTSTSNSKPVLDAAVPGIYFSTTP